MPTVRLRNINPLGQVDLPLIGRQGEPAFELDSNGQSKPVRVEGRGCLEPGEVFEVDAKLAGRAPSTSKDDAGNDVFDPGEGLLAQVGNYELVEDGEKKGGRSR